jgi:hypothetical protein
MGIKAIVAILALVVVVVLGIHGYMGWKSSITNQISIKVSSNNYGYDMLSGSHTTEVLGFDGKEQLCFWDNQTALFLPNHSYLIVYHSDYRGLLLPICADTIVSITPINDTP